MIFCKTDEIRRIKQMQEQNITDEYTVGIYNGIEMCLAIMENREPEFKTVEKETEIKEAEEEQENRRTIASGIIRKGLTK